MLAEWTWVIAQMAPWRFTSSLTLTTSREGKREKIKKESYKQEMINICPDFAISLETNNGGTGPFFTFLNYGNEF